MTMVKHELRQGRIAWIIWTGVIAAMMAICVFIFPEMKGEMDSFNDAFASMGAFTSAFGMDQLNFGTLIGYYAIECGNVLGLGGAFFAALTAVATLSKEEKDKTAEFLLTHPVSRSRILIEKLIAVLVQVTALSVTVFLVAVGSVAAVGEEIPWKEIALLHTAYYLLQVELAGICFGISAFMRKGSAGAGLGVALLMYFLNLLSNITEAVEFLKYITPFGFTDGADIVTDGKLDGVMILIGMGLAAVGVALAYWKYTRKDIQ